MDSKIRYEIEFPINSSPQLLYQYISTPSGLQEWFADNVNSRGEFFTFVWNDSEERARLASKKSGEKVKFRWVDEENKDAEYYFELADSFLQLGESEKCLYLLQKLRAQ